MIPIKQTILHTETTKGNCLQAAIASILELSLNEVPIFEGDDWYLLLMNWLESFKIELVRWDYEVSFKGLYLVVGQSPRGDFKHIVVYENGKLVHDPHPDGTGLKTIESAWLLLVYNPAIAARDFLKAMEAKE